MVVLLIGDGVYSPTTWCSYQKEDLIVESSAIFSLILDRQVGHTLGHGTGKPRRRGVEVSAPRPGTRSDPLSWSLEPALGRSAGKRSHTVTLGPAVGGASAPPVFLRRPSRGGTCARG